MDWLDPLWPRWGELREAYPDHSSSLLRVWRHGDFHLWNVLFVEDDPPAIAAVYDLDMAARGLRVFDVSYALFFLRHALKARHGDAGEDVGRWRPVYEAFGRGYEEGSGSPLSAGETALVPLQIECIAINFLLCNVALETTVEGARRVFGVEYQSVVDWLGQAGPTLTDTLIGRGTTRADRPRRTPAGGPAPTSAPGGR